MSKAFDEFFESNVYDWRSEQINIENPNFHKAGRVHDWRNHVPYDIKKIWKELSVEERKVIAFFAEEKASDEDWD